jgi:intracellular septation protein A
VLHPRQIEVEKVPVPHAVLATPLPHAGPAAGSPTYRHATPVMILRAVARRLGPQLVEATLIPSVLFFTCAVAFGVWVAFVVALAWSYAAVIRRLVSRRAVPALLVLSTVGLSVRTAVALGSGSTFVYFAQPVVGTTVLGLVFLGSALAGRPLIARFAQDFCSLDDAISCRPGVVGLYHRLTYLWAAVNFLAAATTFALLLALPVTAFVALRPVAMWAITATGIVMTVRAAVRAAHRECLLASVGPGGALAAIAA